MNLNETEEAIATSCKTLLPASSGGESEATDKDVFRTGKLSPAWHLSHALAVLAWQT